MSAETHSPRNFLAPKRAMRAWYLWRRKEKHMTSGTTDSIPLFDVYMGAIAECDVEAALALFTDDAVVVGEGTYFDGEKTPRESIEIDLSAAAEGWQYVGQLNFEESEDTVTVDLRFRSPEGMMVDFRQTVIIENGKIKRCTTGPPKPVE